MIHTIRFAEPDFPVDLGRSRTPFTLTDPKTSLPLSVFVEWSGTIPAQQEAQEFVFPLAATIKAEAAAEAARIMTESRPDGIRFRAIARATLKALRAQAKTATVTMTIASPCVVTWAAHGITAGQPVDFTTAGTLPTGIVAGVTYYVIAAGLAANTFRIATSPGGPAIGTSGSQSGAHTGKQSLTWPVFKAAILAEMPVDDPLAQPNQ